MRRRRGVASAKLEYRVRVPAGSTPQPTKLSRNVSGTGMLSSTGVVPTPSHVAVTLIDDPEIDTIRTGVADQFVESLSCMPTPKPVVELTFVSVSGFSTCAAR